jgi:hypothetical protein
MACAALLLPVHGADVLLGWSSELASAADVFLSDSDLNARWRNPHRELSLLLGVGQINLDYLPPKINILGVSNERNETKESCQFTWREGLDQRLLWNLSCGAYQGFTDYRSVWLDEYYRQLFGSVAGYETADVGGVNASMGGRYEYLEASGLVSWSVGWQQDAVSPAYEKIIFGPLQQGEDTLTTWRFGLGSEHVLTPRLRFKQDPALILSTARDNRYAYSAETVWAITDAWTARLRAEAVKEAEFHSISGGLLVERDWDGKWFAGMAVRAYRDNGQILDPLLISGSAPPLDSLLAQLTLRYSGPNATWRIAVGPYLTRYAELTPGTARFAPLYRNRDWLAVQGAWSWHF